MGNPMQVLDTSALLAWPIEKFRDAICSSTQISELERVDLNRSLLIETIDINWMMPTGKGMASAKKAAQESGDLARLSDVDLDILAICFDLQQNQTDFTLFSDDYRVQNVAVHAKMKVKSINTKGVSAAWYWEAKCKGCRAVRKLDDSPRRGRKGSVMDCDVCGSEMVLKKKRG